MTSIVYNGTFDPFLSIFDASSEEWSHLTYPGWSTVNNGSYGGIATFQDKVFVTDMRTFGDEGADDFEEFEEPSQNQNSAKKTNNQVARGTSTTLALRFASG